jgi:hypothetical protein
MNGRNVMNKDKTVQAELCFNLGDGLVKTFIVSLTKQLDGRVKIKLPAELEELPPNPAWPGSCQNLAADPEGDGVIMPFDEEMFLDFDKVKERWRQEMKLH